MTTDIEKAEVAKLCQYWHSKSNKLILMMSVPAAIVGTIIIGILMWNIGPNDWFVAILLSFAVLVISAGIIKDSVTYFSEKEISQQELNAICENKDLPQDFLQMLYEQLDKNNYQITRSKIIEVCNTFNKRAETQKRKQDIDKLIKDRL